MDLSDLTRAFQPLLDLSVKEDSVTVAGVKLILRTISPLEEADIQKSLPSMEGDEVGTSAMEFVDVFRKETLSRAIVQIGDLDLREVKYVETGEKNSAGVAVKIRKEEAVLKVVEQWPRPILTSVFESFTNLVESFEEELNGKLNVLPPNPLAEKDVLQQRLEDIERQDSMKVLSDRAQEIRQEVSKVSGGLFEEALRDEQS